jgi:hypothetical protein
VKTDKQCQHDGARQLNGEANVLGGDGENTHHN